MLNIKTLTKIPTFDNLLLLNVENMIKFSVFNVL